MRGGVVALPDVLVLLGPFLLVFGADLLQHRRKKRIVAPVDRDDLGIVGRVFAKPPIGRAGPPLRVPRHPDFAAIFAHRRNRLHPGDFDYLLGLVHPQQPDPRGRFHRFDVAAQPDEHKIDLAVAGPDVLLAKLVISPQPRLRFDRRLDLGHRAVVERILEFAAAHDHPGLALLGASQPVHRRHRRKIAGLAAAAAAIRAAVQRFPAKTRHQLLGQLDPPRLALAPVERHLSGTRKPSWSTPRCR